MNYYNDVSTTYQKPHMLIVQLHTEPGLHNYSFITIANSELLTRACLTKIAKESVIFKWLREPHFSFSFLVLAS